MDLDNYLKCVSASGELCNSLQAFLRNLSINWKKKPLYYCKYFSFLPSQSLANLVNNKAKRFVLPTHFRKPTVCNRFTRRMRNYAIPVIGSGTGSEHSRVSQCLWVYCKAPKTNTGWLLIELNLLKYQLDRWHTQIPGVCPSKMDWRSPANLIVRRIRSIKPMWHWCPCQNPSVDQSTYTVRSQLIGIHRPLSLPTHFHLHFPSLFDGLIELRAALYGPACHS